MFHLTVQLKDGRKLSGIYEWPCVMARIDAALLLPNYKSHAIKEEKLK